MAKRTRRAKLEQRTLDARPDSVDFRDQMFSPTLSEVPIEVALEEYTAWEVPILDQGTEGACTGFGLAAVVNYLLRTRQVVPDEAPVSARMLYEMARRYDEWPGEEYSGSSARGAMKGWHKHGVCAARAWPYTTTPGALTPTRARDATGRPLGAYFRVEHQDLVAMHVALAEVGALYATAIVHEGWDDVGEDGAIEWNDQMQRLGGHAFALVAYDSEGFWLQNSWGDDWGAGGFAHISYRDWLVNATDVWVARLGVPITLGTGEAVSRAHGPASIAGYAFNDLRPHIVSVGNDGEFRVEGEYGTDEEAVAGVLAEDFPQITGDWAKKRLLLYAHGGLTSGASAVQRVAAYREMMLEAEVYPLAFVWHTDYWTTLTNILRDAVSRRRSEWLWDAAKDFMLDRIDDALEPLARALTGKAQWDEMKENALRATRVQAGAARRTAAHIAKLLKADPEIELHVAGHSAGSIFHAPLVQLLAGKGTIKSGPMKGKKGYGLPIKTCTLWAPACTVELFEETYLPLIGAGIDRFALYTLTDAAEQDDHCARIYNKSLLYLVSNAFEDDPLIPWSKKFRGVPLLGMENAIRANKKVQAALNKAACDWVLAPNHEPENSVKASRASRHGDFDDDEQTLRSTLARILGKSSKAKPSFHAGKNALAARRQELFRQTGDPPGVV